MNQEARHGGSLAFLAVSAVVIALDQLSKYMVERALALSEAVRVLPVLEIMRLHNSGAAFSFLAGAAGWQRWLFTALALIVSVLLVLWLRRMRGTPLLACAVAMILGGALGNVIDRLRLGQVIDFIAVHWGPHYFPPFNIADSSICIGAGLMLLDTWITSRPTTGPAGTAAPK
ncbi:MAG TPA: signal peptidase II [Steroidobacteraceae bacterium]